MRYLLGFFDPMLLDPASGNGPLLEWQRRRA
jgi:hypothetical protein